MSFSRPALRLKNVLPSTLAVTVLALALCFTDPPGWSVLGKLGWWSLPLGVLLGVVFYIVGFVLTSFLNRYFELMNESLALLHDLFRNFSWFDILLISCMAGISEELLIRGVLQSWLIDYLTPLFGIVIASIVFGLLHYLNRAYVLLTALLGCLFGMSLYFTHSIVLVVVAHAVYDVLAFFIIVKRPHVLGVNCQNDNIKLPIHEQF